MKKNIFTIVLTTFCSLAFSQDWLNIPIPANPGQGKVWEQQTMSDDFNYTAPADNKGIDFSDKWIDFYHNSWTGPNPTVWKKNHSYVADGNLKIKASRTADETVAFSYGAPSVLYTLPTTNLGCITSKMTVKYPVFIEANVKISKSVLASDVWMLSADETQEIDICEAYGGDRWLNEWFSNKRIHLSHHVFIRTPFKDWQPSDEGSFYTDKSTIWNEGYHRIGIYWKDPWNLEYYIDGAIVRTRSGVSQIDPLFYTDETDPKYSSQGSGLNKEMNIIINSEDQTWRAVQELSPTITELSNEDNTTFNVDWIRIYKPVETSTAIHKLTNIYIHAFPNPCTNSIQIKSDKTIKQLLICQMNGVTVKQTEMNRTSITLSTIDLEIGIYILKVQMTDGSWTTQKMIKQ